MQIPTKPNLVHTNILKTHYRTMISSESQALNSYYPDHQNHSISPPNFTLQITHNNPAFNFSRLLTNLSPNHQTSPSSPLLHELMISNDNSTSDEADNSYLLNIMDERKKRRMISNRESARRSRMRKQRQLDELWALVVRLRTENHNLVDKLSSMSESHDKVVRENARLKEETCDLRRMLMDHQVGDSYSIFGDLEEIPSCRAEIRVDQSEELSVGSSTELLN